jgi:hypothetical protein
MRGSLNVQEAEEEHQASPIASFGECCKYAQQENLPCSYCYPQRVKKEVKGYCLGSSSPREWRGVFTFGTCESHENGYKSVIFELPVTRVHDAPYKRKPQLFVACYRTLARAIKAYEERKVLLIPGDEGIKPG